MIKLTEKLFPEIAFKATEDLTKDEVFMLTAQGEQSRSNWFMFMKRKDVLYINSALQDDKTLLDVITAAMTIRYSDTEGFDQFLDYVKTTYGETAENVFYQCWYTWRKERNAADDAANAGAILDKCRELHLDEEIEGHAATALKCYEIGANYFNDQKMDTEKGVCNAFMYGYMVGNGANGNLLARNLNSMQMSQLEGVQRSKYMMMIDIDMLQDEELVNSLYQTVSAYVKLQHQKRA